MSEAYPCFYLVACEPSGDLLGARLMQALKKLLHGRVRFAGVGGERMQAEGLATLFHQSELALFGAVEIIHKIPLVMRRLADTAKHVKYIKPAAVITIDAPGFSFRLARRIKKTGIPLIHYVAPTVWAWRPKRAKKVARYYNHLMVLLPFEPPYFEKEGLATTFVGHSILEQGADKGDAARFRQMANIPPHQKIITVLPGSRRSEIERLAPIFGETLRKLLPLTEGFTIVVPTVPQVMEFLSSFIKSWPVRPIVLLDDQQKYDAFAASHLALAASGTVALELAQAGVPHIISYRLHPLTALIYRRFIKVKYVNLVNLLLDKLVVPELLQFDCTPEKLTEALIKLWSDEEARDNQKSEFSKALALLESGSISPSEKVARTVLKVVGMEAPP